MKIINISLNPYGSSLKKSRFRIRPFTAWNMWGGLYLFSYAFLRHTISTWNQNISLVSGKITHHILDRDSTLLILNIRNRGCNGAKKRVPADVVCTSSYWQVKVFGSGLIDVLSNHLSVRTIPVYGCTYRYYLYTPFSSQ